MEFIGLTSAQAKENLQKTGLNEIPQKKQSLANKFIHKLFSPISIMLFAASLLSLLTHKVFDFFFILFLLLANVVIALWQENKADNAIRKLNQHLVTKIKALRDGNWIWLDSRQLTKDDVVQVSVGDIIPADGKVLQSHNLSINEAALTGESLPQEKNADDAVYSGSFLTTGTAYLKITATGVSTYFGKTLSALEVNKDKSALEIDILKISKFLAVLSIVGTIIMTTIFLLQHDNLASLLTLDLSLIIASIPISLPTVMTLIIEFGVINLAPKNVVVRRLSALEDLANVNLLLTDKTGTLTLNKISVNKIFAFTGFQQDDILKLAYLNSSFDDTDSINQAVIEKYKAEFHQTPNIDSTDFTPADSDRKRSTLKTKVENKLTVISVGAPQIVESFCQMSAATKKQFTQTIDQLASQGFRALAIAINQSKDPREKKMQMAGVIALSDTLRIDAKEVISFMKENSINVVMLTGDNLAISKEVASELGLADKKIVTRKQLTEYEKTDRNGSIFLQTGAVAEILPEDKYKLVKMAKQTFIVAVNGDGVNDLPALKEANVGIAVKNAVDALKSTADVVLLSDGIGVIKDAIIESRKIFARVYSYSVYRISESFRLIVTIVVLGIIYHLYPLTPLQIILIALLNDIPIISLAFDRVKNITQPARINVKERFILSTLFGTVGICNSLILFFVMKDIINLDWNIIQTVYFLKLTVSGHLLIYVARTKLRWYKFLPSKEVILATSITQSVATLLALTGLFMPAKLPIYWVIIVWIWAFAWMQIAEVTKQIQKHFSNEAKLLSSENEAKLLSSENEAKLLSSENEAK
ncbi:plasma-membrane proton-efflux P-type ATPase [Patescibacteria group bacterium]|nr:plasma-membrane proton-efflux P-type ATPase [Patescibacteria group bacterium]